MTTLQRLCFGQRVFVLSLALIVLFALAVPMQASVLTPNPGVIAPPDIFGGCAGCVVLSTGSFPLTQDSNHNWEASGVYAVVMDPNAVAGVRAGNGLDFLYQITNAPSPLSTDAIGRLTAINFTGYATDVGYQSGGPGGYCPGTFSCLGTGTPGAVDRNTADTIGFNFVIPPAVPMTPGTTSVILEIETNATLFQAGHQSLLDGGTLDEAAFQPAQVPEPATTLLIGIGMLGLASLRRFRRS